MTIDPYVDPVSGVLRNRLGVTDPDLLNAVEAGSTVAALADLGVRILPGDYDLAQSAVVPSRDLRRSLSVGC